MGSWIISLPFVRSICLSLQPDTICSTLYLRLESIRYHVRICSYGYDDRQKPWPTKGKENCILSKCAVVSRHFPWYHLANTFVRQLKCQDDSWIPNNLTSNFNHQSAYYNSRIIPEMVGMFHETSHLFVFIRPLTKINSTVSYLTCRRKFLQ